MPGRAKTYPLVGNTHVVVEAKVSAKENAASVWSVNTAGEKQRDQLMAEVFFRSVVKTSMSGTVNLKLIKEAQERSDLELLATPRHNFVPPAPGRERFSFSPDFTKYAKEAGYGVSKRKDSK